MRGCWWHISGCAIRLKAFDDVGEFDARMAALGDWEWLLRSLAHGWSVEYIPRTLIRYRQHEASVSALSFRMDHDIRDSLEIIGRHAAVLSRWDTLALHGRRMRSCARRLARAVFQLDVRRAILVLQTSWMVLVSLVRIVAWGPGCAGNPRARRARESRGAGRERGRVPAYNPESRPRPRDWRGGRPYLPGSASSHARAGSGTPRAREPALREDRHRGARAVSRVPSGPRPPRARLRCDRAHELPEVGGSAVRPARGQGPELLASWGSD